MAADSTVRFFDLDRVLVDARLLSVGEGERVARKGTPLLRQRQAASFQCLRLTLGDVLGVAPSAVPIAIAENGKPFLAGSHHGELHFSVSHSDGLGMLAWGPHEIGADVEHLIARPSDGLAGEILSDRELARWRALPEALRQAWLTRAWVRKEAALKAAGSGLRVPPRTIDIGGGDDEGMSWEVVLDARRWIGRDVVDGVPGDYRAAICVERHDG